ncbi:hypothetical protein G7054_g12541 [Neopestalotiopsis clavispora]|nr:hypothetical protein G7054_g12541 [Neopestalotiopsis clavispora]
MRVQSPSAPSTKQEFGPPDDSDVGSIPNINSEAGKVDCNTHDDLRSAHNILRRWPRFQLSDVTLPAWIKTLSPHGIPSREAIGTPDWPNATRTHEALTNTIMESCTAAYGSPAIWSY